MMRPIALMGVVGEPERVAEGPIQTLHKSRVEHVLCAQALPEEIKHAIEEHARHVELSLQLGAAHHRTVARHDPRLRITEFQELFLRVDTPAQPLATEPVKIRGYPRGRLGRMPPPTPHASLT